MTDESNKPGQSKGTSNRQAAGSAPGAEPKTKRPTLSLDKDKQEALRKAVSGADAPGSEPESASGEKDIPIEEPSPTEQIGNLTTQVEKLKNQLLLSQADIQNLHKRFERERAETAKFAISNFARDIVGVVDNFERAISSVPEEAPAENEALRSLLDGVTIAEREFLNILERHGVKRINPEGEIFDPHQHQAMMEQEDASVAAGTILQVVQCGYLIGARVLRPAMVLVAKGGEKPVRGPKAADQNGVAGASTDAGIEDLVESDESLDGPGQKTAAENGDTNK